MPAFDLLVTDIDGTLLDQHGQLPLENIRALQAAADRGIRLALATGRNLTITHAIAAAIEREMYLILQDGCLILHYPSLQVLDYHNLSLPTAKAALRIFAEAQLSVMRFDPLPHGKSFAVHHYGPFSRGLEAYLGNKGDYFVSQGNNPPNANPSKIVTLDEAARVADLCRYLQQSLPKARIMRTEAVRLQSWFLEVGSPFASKAQGLTTLLQHLDLSPARIIAVGDAENDVEIIQMAGLGVAMGNASERVKSLAKLVIGSNAAGGLAKFIRSVLD